MKKLLLLFTALLTFVYSNINAQSCTPNLPNGGSHGDIVPDTIVNLPHATVGVPYSTDIQFYIATDTFAQGFNNTIVDYTLTSIEGMPPGFSYVSNPANGVFPGGQSSCLNAYGTPPPGSEGTYPLLVNVTAHLLINGLVPYTQNAVLTGYKAVINPDGTVGISTNSLNEFELGQNIPNPSSELTRISFTSPVAETLNLNIYNPVGQIVLQKEINAKKGSNEEFISTASFAEGIYIYTLRNSTSTLSKRMMVAKK
ncbi:MAG: hypothetical protein POELPBGB_03259 [Bacteroidia bacterium]|nr:hypothetical protein [Bacteroidia bacterium]